MDISLITSLYRSEKHLSQYVERASDLIKTVQAAGYHIEIIVIANDATPDEKQLLEALHAQIGSGYLTIEYTPRESLYASWNRGASLASGQAIGPWNVDDIRMPDALIEGYERIRQGCELVYFPWKLQDMRSFLGFIPIPHFDYYAAEPFEPKNFSVRMLAGPFFMFSPDLYKKVGPFDERFHILGDLDWAARAAQLTTFCACDSLGGIFVFHGGNLSHPRRRAVEENATFLKHGYYDYLIQTDPSAMREGWEPWSDEYSIPDEIQDWLWGNGAEQRWRNWRREYFLKQMRTQISEHLRILPRLFVDRMGLRSVLFRLGVVRGKDPVT